jgi:Fe-Mn family superoxide dismutase
MPLSRRDALGLFAAGGASTLLRARDGIPLPRAAEGEGQGMDPVPPAKSQAPLPLPFDPSKLKGLSEKLLVSHHDHNYAGAVKNLNVVRAELAGLAKTAPGFLVGGLRAKELAYANSVTLHEAYFANLGGDGKADGPAAKALAAAWGSVDAWVEAFKAIGNSLGGGSGWAVLDLHLPSGELRCAWAGDHSQALAGGLPLLVMDMYEHSYQMDYGASAGKYIDAFFANLNWDEVNRRLERGRRVLAAFRASA